MRFHEGQSSDTKRETHDDEKGDDDQQLLRPTTSEDIAEYSSTTFWFTASPYTAISSSNDGSNFTDIVRVLSQVELPSPSPTIATSCTTVREENFIAFQEGQTSGANKIDETEGHIERERELKDKNESSREPGTRRAAPATHSITMQRRRSQIHEKIRALKALVPNCNKRDQASILDDAIKYIRSLQMQVQLNQMMQYMMGVGAMPQGFYASPTMQQSVQGPYVAPYYPMRPMIETGYSTMGQYAPSSYFNPSGLPICPPFFTGINPLVPPMEVGTAGPAPGVLPIPHLQYPSHSSEAVNSTTLSSNTIIPTTGIGSGISAQSSYHMIPVTSQEMQQVSTAIVLEATPPNLLLTGAQMKGPDSNDGQEAQF